MSEQPHESQTENTGATDFAALYKEAHPNAVEDVKKAELMARAGDAAETEVAKHRTAAYEAADKIGDPGTTHSEIGDEIIDHIEAAEDARELADEKEREVGGVYDKVKDL